MLHKCLQKFFLLGFFTSLCSIAFSQDLIVKINGDTISCRIISIDKEKINTQFKHDKAAVSTFIYLDQVKTYSFGLLEKLKAELDTHAVYNIEFNEGSEIYAKILHIGQDDLVVKSLPLGKLNIKVYHIRKIESEKFSMDKKGKYWFPNPNATRYFFAPSAINLEKGSGYYQNVYVLLNMFNYGITDWFSIGAGFEFISTFSSESKPIAFITPKVGFPVGEKFHLGCGFIGGFFAEETAGMLYGLGSYGSTDRNISVGLGWGFVGGEFQENPFVTLSGMLRVGRKFSFVSENWFIPTEGYYAVISYGGRFFGPKMSVDIGFLNNMDIIEVLPIGIPYVDFVLKF